MRLRLIAAQLLLLLLLQGTRLDRGWQDIRRLERIKVVPVTVIDKNGDEDQPWETTIIGYTPSSSAISRTC